MANFFTRALDKITPWNRGGEVQRGQEAYAKKKKKEEEQQNTQNQAPSSLRVRNTPSTQRVTVEGQAPQPQQPENIFETLNKGLVFNKPNNAVDIIKDAGTKPYEQPKPGTIVQPTLKVVNNNSSQNISLPDGRTVTAAPAQETVESAINRGLDSGKSWEQIARETRTDVNDVRNYSESTRPNYGIAKLERPKQSIGNRFRDIFDTNTESDKFRRQQGNMKNPNENKDIVAKNPGSIISRTPIVGHIVKALNTLGAQGAQIPATIEGKVYTDMQAKLTQEMLAAQKAGNTFSYNEAKRKLELLQPLIDKAFREQDAGSTMFEKNKGGLFNAGTLYDEEGSRKGDIKTGLKDVVAPTAVSMLDLYTLGQGSVISEGLKQSGKAGLRTVAPNILKATAGNYASGDINARAEGATGWDPVKAGSVNAALGIVPDVGLPIIGKSFKSRVLPKIFKGGRVATKDVVEELDDAAISASAEAYIQATKPRSIPVRAIENIPVQAVEGLPEPIRVRNLREPGKLIQEFPGDASVATPDALIKKTAEDIRAEAMQNAAFDQAKTAAVPNPAIEGIIPGTPNKPFTLTPEAVATGQAKIVQDYAAMLKDLGEGNGVNLIPDGEAYGFGKKRVSNNVRFGDTGGKRMTKQMWLDEAQRQLDSGNAEPGIQKAFNDVADPEVQSMLARGEQAPVPEGRPIAVKSVQGIDVTDNTKVPTGLPETPGKVRAIESTAPSNVKSATAAAQSIPVAPVAKEVAETTTETATKTAGAAAENLPRAGEAEDVFLKRVAEDMQSNIKRAVAALKATKKMTKAERAQRAAAGEAAYQEAKAAGKSIGEQEAARKSAYEGTFGRQDYAGSPIHSADEQRLRDMVDAHYKDMPYQAGNVREAFDKLFHSGEEGWHSAPGNHIIPSDIKNIRKFLNESVPNVDGNGGLGDFAEAAIKELSAADPGPGKIANAIGLQRALRFTADISATGRQALPGALSHPIEFARAAKKSFEVMFSHEKYQKFVSELANNKEANYINDRLGAYLSVLNDDISKADDIYRNSGWAHKIPGVNKVVAASERQYNALLSGMRYASGKRFIDAAGGIAQLEKIASESGDPDNFLKAIGTVSNVNTGRGQLGNLGANDSKILSNVLVSPRGLAARIQRFNPKYYTDLMKANPAAGKEALRSLGIQTAVTVSALGAANAAGLYENGQIKVGNTRYDITGGAANMIRTAVRVAQYIGGSRETSPFNNAETEVTRWARNQLAPFLASSLDAIGIHQDPKSGTWINRWGEDVTLASTILDNFAPVNASQVASDRNLGTSGTQTAINAGLNTLGIGVNTYESSEDKSLPKDKTARDVYKQLEKDGIGTSTTEVNNYIADGDYDSATRAAEYNLMALQSDPESSGSQIKKAENVLQEIKLRQEGVPMTDDGIAAKVEDGDWDSAIKGYQWKIDKAKRDGEISQKTEQGLQNDIKRAGIARDNNIAPELYSAYKSVSETDWRKMGIPPGDKNYDEDFYDPEMYQKLWEIDQKMTGAGVSEKTGKLDKPKYTVKDAKGRGGGSGTRQLDTSFGTLKAGTGAPTVQQYDTISVKSGSIPHISVVRPNIVHKISSN